MNEKKSVNEIVDVNESNVFVENGEVKTIPSEEVQTIGSLKSGYRIDDDAIYVEDACHSQNIHEVVAYNRLKRLIRECMSEILGR